jgi:hypothetical protein
LIEAGLKRRPKAMNWKRELLGLWLVLSLGCSLLDIFLIGFFG